MSLKYRQAIPESRRVVVKIGSRVLVQRTGRPDTRRMRELVRELAKLQQAGYEIVIVSSGAVGAGMESLGMHRRPTALPDLQMAAAVGQARLMASYGELFGKFGLNVGQILLTHADFQHRGRHVNARRTIENLIRSGVVPIINENDVVADEEIRADLTFGDNDSLAALVVRLVRADLLVMLTTVDGVRYRDGSDRSRRLSYIEEVNRKVMTLVNTSDDTISKGGMATKLKAAREAAGSGCAAVIANGRKTGVLTRIMQGADTGTLILAD